MRRLAVIATPEILGMAKWPRNLPYIVPEPDFAGPDLVGATFDGKRLHTVLEWQPRPGEQIFLLTQRAATCSAALASPTRGALDRVASARGARRAAPDNRATATSESRSLGICFLHDNW